MRLFILIAVIVVASAPACAFPRRTTPLSSVPETQVTTAPGGVLRLRLESATIPPRDRGARAWDEDGTAPDTFVRIYRDDELLVETGVRDDSLEPLYSEQTGNLYLPRSANIRIEIWDRDFPRQAAIVGSWQGRGLPRTALVDAVASIELEGGTMFRFRVLPAVAHRGTGIMDYEVRGSSLVVGRVLRFSPAGRADIQPGDSIVSIDGQSIESLGDDAPGALSVASSRRSTLRVRRGEREREVTLDREYVFLLASESR